MYMYIIYMYIRSVIYIHAINIFKMLFRIDLNKITYVNVYFDQAVSCSSSPGTHWIMDHMPENDREVHTAAWEGKQTSRGSVAVIAKANSHYS